MKKTSLLAFLIACSALFVACTHQVSTDTGSGATVPASTGSGSEQPAFPAQDTSSVNPEPTSQASLPGSSAKTASSASTAATQHSSVAMQGDVTIHVVATNFAFTPNVIHVKKGQKVKLVLEDAEGLHGFGIPQLGINVALQPGQPVVVALPTDTAGTFDFRCTIPCGPGHMGMTGQIIID